MCSLFRTLLIWLCDHRVHAENLVNSMWNSGIKFFYSQNLLASTAVSKEAPKAAEDDLEVRPLVKTLLTHTLPNTSLGSSHFSRFT